MHLLSIFHPVNLTALWGTIEEVFALRFFVTGAIQCTPWARVQRLGIWYTDDVVDMLWSRTPTPRSQIVWLYLVPFIWISAFFEYCHIW